MGNEKMIEWQDISTAPKDGTVILLGKSKRGMERPEVWPGAWCPAETGDEKFPWLFWERLNDSQVKPNAWSLTAPTHWQPLPQPPSPSQEKSNG